MRSRRKLSVAVLAVAVAVIGGGVSSGGCAGKRQGAAPEMEDRAADLRAAVRKTVADPERAAAVARAIDDLEAAERDARASRAAERHDLRELNADYDATREQFAVVLQRHADARAGHRRRLAAARDQMIANTTDAEWTALAKPRAAVGRAGSNG
jgi:hypothetical protein